MSSIPRTVFKKKDSTVPLEHPDTTVETDLHGHDQGAIYQDSNDDFVHIKNGDIVIAILGPSGSGKSEFINTVVGRKVAPTSATLNSCTEEVRAYKCKHPVDERYVILVDTPGLDDSDRSDFTVLDDVTRWLHETYIQNILLSGVLQLHNISEMKMRGPQVRGLETLRELCGPDAKTNLVMLTTFWDLVDVGVATAREAELIEKFWRTDFLPDGAVVRRLQPRTRDHTWELIDLFKTGARLTPKPLRIQVEMGDKHKRFYETSVFRYLLCYWTSIVDEFRGVGQVCTPSAKTARNSFRASGRYDPDHLYPMAGAPVQVSTISYSYSSSLAAPDYYAAYDDGTGNIISPLTNSISSTTTSFAKPGPMLGSVSDSRELSSASSSSSIRTAASAQTAWYSAHDDTASAEGDNYNPVAEELARMSLISFTTSDSSATTDYGSSFFSRELSQASSIRTVTSPGRGAYINSINAYT